MFSGKKYQIRVYADSIKLSLIMIDGVTLHCNKFLSLTYSVTYANTL
jgi:hypothetical protein